MRNRREDASVKNLWALNGEKGAGSGSFWGKFRFNDIIYCTQCNQQTNLCRIKNELPKGDAIFFHTQSGFSFIDGLLLHRLAPPLNERNPLR